MNDEEFGNNKRVERRKPLVLVLLDGWGIAPESEYNNISQAKTKTFDRLISTYPAMTLLASGQSIGRKWGASSNAALGYRTIGTGAIQYEQKKKIDEAIANGSFFENKVILNTLQYVKKQKSNLHLIGLLSESQIHSSYEHLIALLKLAKQKKLKNISIHLILDGIDVSKKSAEKSLINLQDLINDLGIGVISSIVGRDIGMDMNYKWENTQEYIQFLTSKKTKGKFKSADNALSSFYKNSLSDNEVAAISFDSIKIQKNDAVIDFNYTASSSLQLLRGLTQAAPQIKLDIELPTHLLSFISSQYGLPISLPFADSGNNMSLSQVYSEYGLSQVHISSETSFHYNTYYLNGEDSIKHKNEEWIMINSQQSSFYDFKPENLTKEITQSVLNSLLDKKNKLIIVSFSSAFITARQKNNKKIIKSIEGIDKALDKILKAVLNVDGVLAVTSGFSCLENINNETSIHTLNPVPFIIASNDLEGTCARNKETIINNDLSLITPVGTLIDIVPTLLAYNHLTIPSTMLGENLLSKD